MAQETSRYQQITQAARRRMRRIAATRASCITIAVITAILLAVIVIGAFLIGPSILGWKQAPNFVGLPEGHAIYYLRQYDLDYKVISKIVVNDNEAGIVISQSPMPGRFVKPDEPLVLTVTQSLSDPTEADSEPIATVMPSNNATQTSLPVIEPTTDAAVDQTPTVSPEMSATATMGGPTPQGGGHEQLAFASDRGGDVQIWLTALDGNDLLQLTDLDGGACQPAWSPDGRRILFVSPCHTNKETYPGAVMWVISADGTGLEALPTEIGGDYDPRWSPDGTMIAFTSIREEGRAQVFLMNVLDRTVRNLSNNSVQERQPGWSPDGALIAYSTPSSSGLPTIFIRTLADGETEQFSREMDRKNTRPVWSPDGSMIVYNQDSGLPRLVGSPVVELGFGGDILLPANPMPMRDASFSPDGIWIAFESWPNGIDHDIWIAMVFAGQPQRVTDDKYYDFDPAWRP